MDADFQGKLEGALQADSRGHAHAVATAVCGLCRVRLTAATSDRLQDDAERRGWHRTPAGSWYCVDCVTGDDGRQ